MPVTEQAEGVIQFAKRHPILSALGVGVAAVVGKKEYDRRYKDGKSHHDKEDEED